MMTNLFSIFDPATSTFFSLNWLVFVVIIILLPINYYYLSSLYYYLHLMLMKIMFIEFKLLLKSLMSNMVFITIMYIVFLMNFMGLFPYIFTLTSHMVLTVSFSLPLWLGMMMFGWYNYSLMMFAHLVPYGTPSMLMSFMVLIESISSIIRPLTLSVRLSANMIAGHLLLCLMGSVGSLLDMYMVLFLVIIQSLLYLLEISVSLIQSYVFAILCSLYCSEVEYD